MAENFPILMSHTKTQIQEAQKTKKLKKKSTPRYVLFQLEKKKSWRKSARKNSLPIEEQG